MRLDRELLEASMGFRDLRAGIVERFLRPVLGQGRTVAVLTQPAGEQRSMGWVLCHAYGIEQIHRGRLDVLLARELAGSGWPALRYHGAGYGDAELGMRASGPASHLAEAADAVRTLVEETGVEQVGVIGSRFGATVAALVAERLELPAMVLVGPVVAGRAYAAGLVRSILVKRAVAHGSPAVEAEDPSQTLERDGELDVNGFPLSLEAYRAFQEIDLLKDLVRFRGAALILSPGRAGEPAAPAVRLAGHLRSLGADVAVEGVADRFGAQFGDYRWRTIEGGRSKADVQLELDEELTRRTGAWARNGARPW